MLGDPVTELTIAMEVDYFQLNGAEYFIPLIVKIPGSELALARKGGAEHSLIDFIGEVKDDFGSTIQNVRDKIDLKLSDKTAAELTKVPIQYETGLHRCCPGNTPSNSWRGILRPAALARIRRSFWFRI